jgi:hypothetical protein
VRRNGHDDPDDGVAGSDGVAQRGDGDGEPHD